MSDRVEEWAGRWDGWARHLAGSLKSILGTLGMALVVFGLVRAGSEGPSDGAAEPKLACRALLEGRKSPVFTLAWSPDGRSLAVSGFGPTLRLWDWESGQVHVIEPGTEQPRFILGWSDAGHQLIVSGLDVPVEIWGLNLHDFAENRHVERPVDRAGMALILARATRGASIRVRGTNEQRSSWLPCSGQTSNSAAFAPDGRTIVTADNDQSLRIWDVASGRLRLTLQGEPRGFSSVAFSPDSSKLASVGGGSLKIWDPNSGALVATLGGSTGGSAIVGFSPDGRRVAAARWDGSIRIWDLSTGLERVRLVGNGTQILAMAWSPDGKTLASGGYDSTVRLWDVAEPVESLRAD